MGEEKSAWVVDVTGLDIDVDISHAGGGPWLGDMEQESRIESSLSQQSPLSNNGTSSGEGDVIITSPNTLQYLFEERVACPPKMRNPMDLCTIHSGISTQRSARSRYFQEEESSATESVLCVFALFLRPEPVYLSLACPEPRGVDVMRAVLLHALTIERQLRGYSSDPFFYKLHIADQMGNFNYPLSSRAPIRDFDCFGIEPTPGAQMVGYDRGGLQQFPASDIRLTVRIFCTVSRKTYDHQCIAPADLLVGKLELMIARLLPNNPIVRKSLKIVCGKLLFSPSEVVNLGPGLGGGTGKLEDHTVLTLFRCGIREVQVLSEAESVVAKEDLETPSQIQTSLIESHTTQVQVTHVNHEGDREPALLSLMAENMTIIGPTVQRRKRFSEIRSLQYFPEKKAIEIIYPRGSFSSSDRIELGSADICSAVYARLELQLTELENQPAADVSFWRRLKFWS